MNNFAHLKAHCIFYPLFKQGWVPIKNILLPQRGMLLGDGAQDIYLVDLDKLTPEQFDAVATLVQRQCDPSTPLDQCKAEIRERGLPLRAKLVASVSSDVPLFL